MLGPIMDVRVNDTLTVRLAPFSREDAKQFVAAGGLQARSITRYLGLWFAPTEEQEQEWYDKAIKDEARLIWGIWDTSGKTPKLIGNTALVDLQVFPVRQMTSGSIITNKSYWGRGIGSAVHKARTWYGFKEFGLVRIKSAVMLPNIGSKKALARSGYFVHSIERNIQFTEGQFVHQENLECLNPSEHEWTRWWGDDAPSKEALAARKVTQEALAWADQNVTLL